MIGLLRFVLVILAAVFRSKARVEAENAALRHQLFVLRRKCQGQGSADQRRPLVFCPAVSLVSVDIAGSSDHSAGNASPLAPRWISQLLALEIPE
jgi:hypothetical protein